MEMTRIAARADARIQVSDYEVRHNFRGETYHFVKRLLEEDFAKKQYNFSYIIGMDNANSFPSWVNSADLERMIRFVVVPRVGVAARPEVTWYKKSPHIVLAGGDRIRNTSSTAARELLKHNEDSTPIMEVLDKEVYKYIRHNHLYEETK
jgi:nicotinate-nucleotide adenylyltransferase